MEKKSIFDYIAQILMIFGLMVVFLSVCSCLAGSEGKEHSTLFSLGAEGMSMASLAQMLGLAILTSFIRWFFFSDRLFKRLSVLVRSIGMVVCCVAVIVAFVIMFDWFPSADILAWLLFALSFVVCFTVSLLITLSKQKHENQAMEKALQRLKSDE